jgi:hypothetical protein
LAPPININLYISRAPCTTGGEDHLRAARKYYAAAADMSNATDVKPNPETLGP